MTALPQTLAECSHSWRPLLHALYCHRMWCIGPTACCQCCLQALSQQPGLQVFNDLTQLGDVMRLSSRGEHRMHVVLTDLLPQQVSSVFAELALGRWLAPTAWVALQETLRAAFGLVASAHNSVVCLPAHAEGAPPNAQPTK